MALSDIFNAEIYATFSQEVRGALAVFTKEELDSIRAIYSWETREFTGLQFVDPVAGIAFKWADVEKMKALSVLEAEIYDELKVNSTRV